MFIWLTVVSDLVWNPILPWRNLLNFKVKRGEKKWCYWYFCRVFLFSGSFYFLVRVLKFYSLNKFQLHNTVLSITVMLCISFSDVIHVITESFYPFTRLFLFPTISFSLEPQLSDRLNKNGQFSDCQVISDCKCGMFFPTFWLFFSVNCLFTPSIICFCFNKHY